MADNFDVTAGTGTTIRAVEKNSKKAQTVTLDIGGAGAESLLTTSMPIQDGGNSITVDNGGTFAVQASIAAAQTLATLTSITNPVTVSGMSMNSGNTDATTIRVITAADGPLNTAIGTTTQARNTATDTTAVSEIQLLKQISYMEQNPASRAVTTPLYSSVSSFTGIITVTTSGVLVNGPDNASSNGYLLKGHPSNTGIVWVMPSGVSKASGYPLNTSEVVPLDVTNLNLMSFDANVSGEKICYIKL
jgi:hypothetical protein